MSNNYLIIGSGAAGLAAAQSIRKNDPTANVQIVTAETTGYYSRPGLAYYLAREIPRSQLFPLAEEYFREIGLKFIFKRTVEILPEQRQICLEDQQLLSYDRLLIACGASAQRPNLAGINCTNVVTLDSMADADHICKLARKGKTAVVIGGGITALELVEGLHAHGMKVQYLLRGERYWGAVLDDIESKIVERRLEEQGVTIRRNTQLIGIFCQHEHVRSIQVETKGKAEQIQCGLLAMAIGIRPRVELAKRADLAVKRGILVDEFLQSSHADIFAAGDVAETRDPISHEYTLDSLWGPAIEMGTIAGMNMTGQQVAYRKLMPFNVTRLAGLVTTIIGQVGKNAPRTAAVNNDLDLPGIMRGDSETWRILPDGEVAQTYQGDNRLRLYIQHNLIRGALVMGDQTLSYPLQRLIREEIDINEIHHQLLQPGATLHAIISQFWQDYTRRSHAIPAFH